MNFLAYVSGALVLSILGNIWLYNSKDDLRDKLTVANQSARIAGSAAMNCSNSVDQLKREAIDAQREAAEATERAEALARQKTVKGTQTLQRQPSTPGDMCKSTSDLLQQWRRERASK